MTRNFLYVLTGAVMLTLAACDKAPPPAPKTTPQKDQITPTPAPKSSPGAPALPEPKGDSVDPAKK